MYYVGTRQFPSLYEAIAYLSANPAPGLQVTTEPVGDTSGGMLTGSDTSNRTYTYVRESSDLPGGSSRDIWNATEVNTTTGHSGLTDLFNSRKEYQQIFGSADNFISYMDQMYDLQQANPELYNWWETDTAEQFADANGYPPEAAYEGLEAAAQREFDREYLDYQIETREQQFINMSQSGDYRGLVEQFGLNDVIRNDDGDIFAFNGGFPVEIYEVDDHLSVDDYGRIALAIGLSLYAGPFLSSALAPGAGAVGTTLGAAASGAVTSAMSQLIISGEIDINQMAEAALTAGVSTAAVNALREAGTIEQVTEWLNSQVGEFVQLEDGQLFQLTPSVGGEWTVTLPSGAVIDYDVFLGLAENVYGSPVVAEISRGFPDWLNTVVDVADPAFQAVSSAIEAATSMSRGTGSGGVGSIVENVQPINDTTTLVSQLEEAIERARNEGDDEQADAIQAELNALLGTDTTTEEQAEEEDALADTTENDDVLADTTTDTDTDTDTAPQYGDTVERDGQLFQFTPVGWMPVRDTSEDTDVDDQPGITDEMFQNVIDQVRADNQVETQEIIDAINALGIADLPTLAQIEEAFPELNDVSLEEIGSTVSTLLSEAGLLTTEQFTEAMSGVLTPEQLATALADLPYGTTEDFAEAVANAGLATPADIVTALTDANLATSDDIAGLARAFAQAGYARPEDIADALAESGLATPQDIADAFEAAGIATPQDIVDAIAEANLATPEDITNALSEFNFTEEQLAQIVDAMPQGVTKQNIRNILNQILDRELADVATGTSLDEAASNIIEAIGGLDAASPEDIKTILSEYGFTDEQLEQIAGAITIPASATVEDVQNIIDNLPAGLTAEQVATELSDQFTGLTEGIAGVQSGVEALAEQLGLSTDGLIAAIAGLGTTTGEDLTDLQTNILTGLDTLADNLGVDIGDVVTSVTDLSTDVVEGIEGLGEQLTGLGEGITGVQGGIDALAEQLGVSSDDIVTAIGNLGTLTSDELTDFETSVLTGLTGLADTLGLDIGDVVTSVTDLGTDLTENITGLSEQLTGVETAVGGVTDAVNQGIDDLATALGVQTDDIEAAIVTLGSGLGGELTELETSVLTGLTTLADSIGVDVGTVVDSIGGLGTGISENIQGLSDALTQQLGEGFGDIGAQLGEGFRGLGALTGLSALGLFGLGASQEQAQQRAAARDFEFKPFEEQMKPRQVQQVVQARRTQQQPSALQQINQFIDRQSNVPRQGMLLPQDPNRNIS